MALIYGEALGPNRLELQEELSRKKVKTLKIFGNKSMKKCQQN